MNRLIARARGTLAVILLGAVWFGCTDRGTVTAPDDQQPNLLLVSQDDLAPAIAAQERHTPALMARAGVVGTGVGLNEHGRPVVTVFVEHGSVAGLPRTVDGFPVAVQVTGKIYALHMLQQAQKCENPPCNGGGGGGGGKPNDPVDPTVRFDRPVPIGISTGHPDITAGTIGARVTDGTNVFALSNNHVYANENNASTGDAVIQPGTFDGGSSPADDIGTLFAFVPIAFSTSAKNVIDAAIASTTTALLDNATPSDGYGAPKSDPIGAFVNMRVMKYGRTTGQTKGRVSAINATVDVGYDTGVARFVGQIVVTPGSFSAGGDSGSLIVVEKGGDDRRPVGLLFAGSSSVTIANPIGAVLSAFGVTIDGQ